MNRGVVLGLSIVVCQGAFGCVTRSFPERGITTAFPQEKLVGEADCTGGAVKIYEGMDTPILKEADKEDPQVAGQELGQGHDRKIMNGALGRAVQEARIEGEDGEEHRRAEKVPIDGEKYFHQQHFRHYAKTKTWGTETFEIFDHPPRGGETCRRPDSESLMQAAHRRVGRK